MIFAALDRKDDLATRSLVGPRAAGDSESFTVEAGEDSGGHEGSLTLEGVDDRAVPVCAVRAIPPDPADRVAGRIQRPLPQLGDQAHGLLAHVVTGYHREGGWRGLRSARVRRSRDDRSGQNRCRAEHQDRGCDQCVAHRNLLVGSPGWGPHHDPEP